MKFKDAFDQAHKLLTNWKENGVDIAGESQDDWLFRGHVINGDDIMSGHLILINKSDGSMRLFNAGRYNDRQSMKTAKVIDF